MCSKRFPVSTNLWGFFLPFHQAFWLVRGCLTQKRFVYHFVFTSYVRSRGLGESRSLTEVLIGYWVHEQWANSSRRTGSVFWPRVASIEQIVSGNLLVYMTRKEPLLMGWSHWSHILYMLSPFILTVIPWEKGRALKMLIHPRLYVYSEKAMAPHSNTLAWKIPWTEEPGRLQSMGSRRVGHDWATSLSLFTFIHWRRKWQPTPVFLPGESQGWGSQVGCHLWGRTESDTTEAA